MADKKKTTTSTERGFYISGKAKLDKADKAKFRKIKTDLSKAAGFTPTDAQVGEYMLRQYLSSQ